MQIWEWVRSREIGVFTVFCLYLLPIFFLSSSPLLLGKRFSPWAFFAVGLLVAAIGSIVYLSLIFQKPLENENEETPNEIAYEEEYANRQEVEFLYAQIDTLEQQLQQKKKEWENAEALSEEQGKELKKLVEESKNLQREKDHYLLELEQLDAKYREIKESSEEALQKQRDSYQEALQTIDALRQSIDHKQRQNDLLDQKISDLKYEIKTLLQIADMSSILNSDVSHGGSSPNEAAGSYQLPMEQIDKIDEEEEFTQVCSCEEARLQLKRCIDIAQKITGSQHFATHKSRFGDFALDSYAHDLRRLCDSLGSENRSTIFVYSPKERKLLYINNQVAHLLGWSPEKFIQQFDNIVQEGMFEWRNSLTQLSSFNQTETRFVMRTRNGEDLLVHCQIGLIPTGLFRNNVIGVLYPA